MSGKRRFIAIGVTGGIGSGKSEVCKIFENLGVPVLSADAIAKEISNYDPRVKQLLIKLLGPQAYTPDGVLDRPYVASRVFSSESIQKRINAVIHPRVEDEVRRKFSEMERSGTPIGMVEAALIYEAGLDRLLDAVVVVDAGESNRIERVVNRDGSTRSSVLDRMKAQMDPNAKVKKADYIIHNDGSIEELKQKVGFLYSIFQKLTEQSS
jgi:dephospho-CoA kinase